MDRRAPGRRGAAPRTRRSAACRPRARSTSTASTLRPTRLDCCSSVDPAVWREEAALIPAFYERFGDRLPAALWAQYEALLERLGDEDEAAPPKLALSA